MMLCLIFLYGLGCAAGALFIPGQTAPDLFVFCLSLIFCALYAWIAKRTHTVGALFLRPAPARAYAAFSICLFFLFSNLIGILSGSRAAGLSELLRVGAAGIAEECVFRSYLADLIRKKTALGPLAGAALCALCFGLFHAVNLFHGAAPLAALAQVFCAFCFGFALSILVGRCQSIRPAIIAHVSVNLSACFLPPDNSPFLSLIAAGATLISAILLSIFFSRSKNRP